MRTISSLITTTFEKFFKQIEEKYNIQNVSQYMRQKTDVSKRSQKRCVFAGCGKIPFYAKEGCKARHCVVHKEADEVDVKSARCIFTGCGKQPSYAKEGCKARHCVAHKEADEVDVKNARCIFTGCKTGPSYAKEGCKARHCAAHKEADEVDVKSARCLFAGCTTRPLYAKEGCKARHCVAHKEADEVDVKNARCIFAGCKKRSAYAKEGCKARHCVAHKEADEVNVVSARCLFTGCGKIPSYGVPSYPPEFCTVHKNSSHVRYPLKNSPENQKECEYCCVKIHYLLTLCPNCEKYQETGKLSHIHRKELQVKNLLDEEEIKYEHHDRRITDGCSLFRPDFQISHPSGLGTIILEVDENQHRGYQCECEMTRMRQIYHDRGTNDSLLFVRYNPDSYKGAVKSQSISSERLKYLACYLRNTLKNPLPEKLNVVYLFYDNFKMDVIPEILFLNPDGDFICHKCNEGFYSMDSLEKHVC